jgi:hypothetical protein
MSRDVVWIKTFPDETGAARARDRLRAGGIEAVVSGDREGSAYRVPAPPAGYRIGVRAGDLRAALDLVWNKAGG